MPALWGQAVLRIMVHRPWGPIPTQDDSVSRVGVPGVPQLPEHNYLLSCYPPYKAIRFFNYLLTGLSPHLLASAAPPNSLMTITQPVDTQHDTQTSTHHHTGTSQLTFSWATASSLPPFWDRGSFVAKAGRRLSIRPAVSHSEKIHLPLVLGAGTKSIII